MYKVHITLHNMIIRALDMYTCDRLVVNELLNSSWLLMASDRFDAKNLLCTLDAMEYAHATSS